MANRASAYSACCLVAEVVKVTVFIHVVNHLTSPQPDAARSVDNVLLFLVLLFALLFLFAVCIDIKSERLLCTNMVLFLWSQTSQRALGLYRLVYQDKPSQFQTAKARPGRQEQTT